MTTNETDDWDRLASEIETAPDAAYEKFRGLPKETAETRPTPDAWSAKEVVGHLIDSASNNHQRFVRLQVADGLVFPDYQQDNDAWVNIQRYQEQPWDDLLAHWRYFNLHLARIIRTVDKRCIERIWVVDEDTWITLGELMTDYLSHLTLHLQQIKECMEV